VLLPLLLFPMLIPLLVGAVEATTALMAGDVMGDTQVWVRLMIIFDVIFMLVCLWAFDFVIEE
jgi:heme exporter protein B